MAVETTGETGPRRSRGQSAGLDRARIVDAARGLPVKSLTMQAVADRLGVDRSALHYHVSDRAALIELVAEDLFTSAMSPQGIGPDTDWREGCLLLAHATRDSVIATGHFASYLRLTSPSGEDALAAVEMILTKMRDTGMDMVVAARGIYAMSALAIALAQGQLAARDGEHPQVPETRRALATAGSDRFPVLRGVFEGDGDVFDDDSFDDIIRTFLAGLAVRAGLTS